MFSHESVTALVQLPPRLADGDEKEPIFITDVIHCLPHVTEYLRLYRAHAWSSTSLLASANNTLLLTTFVDLDIIITW